MLPEDCKDCPCCGVPMYYSNDYCDGCYKSAGQVLKLKENTNYEWIDQNGNNATWRLLGLLKRWSSITLRGI